MRLGILLLMVLAALPDAGVMAQTPDAVSRRTIAALRLPPDERIVLDGRLTEAVWRRAIPANDFRQQDPYNAEPATEQTEVRVVFDDHRLVLGVTCFDSEPTRLRGNQLQRVPSFSAAGGFIL